MNCADTKKLIPIFTDGELDPKEACLVEEHIKSCPACQKELELYKKTWAFLSEWKDEEPVPGYVSRFWTKIATQRLWHEEVLGNLKEAFLKRRTAPVLVAALSLVIVMFFAISSYFRFQRADEMLARLSPEEVEFVEYMELAENFEIIENIDFLEDLEIIESIDFVTPDTKDFQNI